MTENDFMKEKQAVLKSMTDTICLTREDAKIMVGVLEEIQKYRAIGTVEQCRKAMEKMGKNRSKLNEMFK